MPDEKEVGQSETQTLIGEIQVEGYTLKPWGICDLAKLAPALERVVNSLRERGVKLSEAKEKMSDIVFSVLPEMPIILANSLKVSMEEIEKMPNEKAIGLSLAIFRLNLVYLKNWLGPAMEAIKKVTV